MSPKTRRAGRLLFPWGAVSGSSPLTGCGRHVMKRLPLVLAALLLLLLPGCGREQAAAIPDPTLPVSPPPWFADITEASGLNFVHDPGPVGSYFMPQSIGSGAALFDFDQDGLLDIYLLHNAGPDSRSTNRLFRQLPGGHFQDVSAGSGLDINGYNMGVAIGDVNNDGFPDVLVTQYTGVKLFLNNGNGTFTDVTEAAGLSDPFWATSAAFVDFDRDGWLDLVVVNYVNYDPSRPCISLEGQQDFCHPSRFPGTPVKLFRNLGQSNPQNPKAVAFADVTLSSGLGRVLTPALGVVCADFNGDGWPDIFVSVDGQANRLWINQHNGTFKDEAMARGLAYTGMGQTRANMGIALGDVDGDGLLDLFITHLNQEQHTLWRQRSPGVFIDETAGAGLAGHEARATGWGTVLADFDHDGALDLAVVAGAVYRGPAATDPALGPFWTNYGERNLLFRGDGHGRFQSISDRGGAFSAKYGVARGLAVGDIDGDGALDMLVTYINGPARLYRNVVPNRGHWLIVRAIDPALRRDAYGSLITINVAGRRKAALLQPAQSIFCSHAPYVHFGVGNAERVDGLHVCWPDGTEEEFEGRTTDQTVTLRKGSGKRKG